MGGINAIHASDRVFKHQFYKFCVYVINSSPVCKLVDKLGKSVCELFLSSCVLGDSNLLERSDAFLIRVSVDGCIGHIEDYTLYSFWIICA